MSKIIKEVQPIARATGKVRIPGSKSITHRALIMAALSHGPSKIVNPLPAEDTELTANALRALGAGIVWEGESALVTPPRKRWDQPRGPIFLGNSGTSTRLLLGVAAAGEGTFIFDGTPRLRERPVGPVADALESLGVEVRFLNEPGFPPVEITSRGIEGGEVWVDAGQSSQFLSALLLAAPSARKDVVVGWRSPVASFPYVALTLAMMKEAGIETEWLNDHQIRVPAPQSYAPFHYTVEGDCSSASYFWAAAAVTGGDVHTSPISSQSLQGDSGLLSVLQEMGCGISWEEDGVRVTGAHILNPVDVDMNRMPDMVPTLAVVAAFAGGRSHIRNVAHLRVKESDRLRVVASELGKLGVPIEETADGLIIEGGALNPPQALIEAHDDHRIAMALAVAGLRIPGVRISGAESVAKSFPTFWELFETLEAHLVPRKFQGDQK